MSLWRGFDDEDSPRRTIAKQHCECCSLRVFGVMPEEALRELIALAPGHATDNRAFTEPGRNVRQKG